ncbi:MAG: YfiR family protein [Candidatus Thiodiazotropha sp.]
MLLRYIFTVLLMLHGWSYTPTIVADEENTNVDLVKAVFIYNIAKFTRWPESSLSDSSIKLNICVLGKDKVSDSLTRLNGRSIQGRTLNILFRKDGNVAPGVCQVLYIAGNLEYDSGTLLTSLTDKHVLTISEIPGFSQHGGMVELKQSEDKIRLIINLRVTKKAGLSMSARLLNLASVIDPGDGS